jgi:hypothetical protein
MASLLKAESGLTGRLVSMFMWLFVGDADVWSHLADPAGGGRSGNRGTPSRGSLILASRDWPRDSFWRRGLFRPWQTGFFTSRKAVYHCVTLWVTLNYECRSATITHVSM